MKPCTVNPENMPRKNGTEPELFHVKRSTERNSRPELIANPTRLTLCTHAGISKLYALQWDVTSFEIYKECRINVHDITAKAWILLCEAEQEQSEELPIFTVIRAIREWIRENRSHGISYNETTEDTDGNTVEKWTQQPAHNNTEAEALHRVALDEAALYIKRNSRTKYSPETIREYLRKRTEDGMKPHTAAKELNMQNGTYEVIENAWKKYRDE